MNRSTFRLASLAGGLLTALVATVFLALSACSTDNAPKPSPLQTLTPAFEVKPTWTVPVGEVGFPLVVPTASNTLAVANYKGQIDLLALNNGKALLRADVAKHLTAGVGLGVAQNQAGENRLAVVNDANQLVVLEGEREIWRKTLPATTYTPPLVAGGRVFILTGERTVMAFDGQKGFQLWTQQRPSEALTLKLPGVLMAVGDTLVVGFSGRLVGLNPDNGSARWEAPIGTPRGVNDVERLVDLVGQVSRQPDTLCARAYSSAVGCVNVANGRTTWSHAANGFTGLAGDANAVYGTESDGKVVAWRRGDGEALWTSDQFKYRQLTAPVLLGQAVVFGDAEGYLHFLASDDGRTLNRLSTDGSGFAAPPVVQGQTLVVVTRKGNVMAFSI